MARNTASSIESSETVMRTTRPLSKRRACFTSVEPLVVSVVQCFAGRV